MVDHSLTLWLTFFLRGGDMYMATNVSNIGWLVLVAVSRLLVVNHVVDWVSILHV